jgi:replicative DNA helicase
VNNVPQDIPAEVCVLGCMILHPKSIAIVEKILTTTDFHRPAHQLIYDAILQMNPNSVDMVTLRAKLESLGILENIGGIEYVVEICEGVPSVSNTGYYCKIVRDRAVRRALMVLGSVCTTKANDGDESDTVQHLGGVQHDIYTLSRRLLDEYTGEATFGQAVQQAIDMQKAAIDDPSVLEGIKTGLLGIDNETNGFKPGQLVVLAADTSAGKSAMALQWATQAAIGGKRVLVISAEMSPMEIGQRIIQNRGGIIGSKLQKGVHDEQDWREINHVQEITRSLKAHVVETSPTVRDIALLARERSSLWGGLDIIFVDYLQLMQSPSAKKSLREQISEITRELKALASELKVPIVLLSQFERGGVKHNVLPTIHNLKESGSIEQDASVIILMYWDKTREYIHDPYTNSNFFETWARVAKNRGGATTTWNNENSEIKFKFYPGFTRFEDLT